MFKRLTSDKEIFFHINVKRFNLIYIKQGKGYKKALRKKN